MLRARKFASLEMTIDVVCGGVPNGTLPIESGPAIRPALSVAVAVSASPDDDSKLEVNEPSAATVAETDADVLTSRRVTLSGAEPVTAFAVAAIVVLLEPSNVKEIFDTSIRGG